MLSGCRYKVTHVFLMSRTDSEKALPISSGSEENRIIQADSLDTYWALATPLLQKYYVCKEMKKSTRKVITEDAEENVTFINQSKNYSMNMETSRRPQLLNFKNNLKNT